MVKINKNIYRIVLIATFLLVNGFILFALSQIFSFLNTGADRSSMLHLAVKSEQVYLPKIIWKDTLNPGRPMEKQTLGEIQKDYLDAWYVKQVAFKDNDSFGVNDFYTQSARKNIFRTIEDHISKKINIEATTTKHNAYLDFYSADGQLVVLTDKNVRELQKVYKNDTLIIKTETNVTYRVLLLLEDGFWKVRHLVKQKNELVQDTISFQKKHKVIDQQLWVHGKPFIIKGMNYYPQASPWDMFGDDFDIDLIAKDFDILTSLRLNTIRVFVQYEDFGEANVDQNKLYKLRQVLDLAQTKNLQVIVTLFDFYGDYSVLNWTLTHRHAEQIVSSFKDHPAILAWDLKNEPNLDFANRGKENVLDWLQEMAHQIRKFDPSHLITIGWSDAKSATLLADTVDLVSFHYYLDKNDFLSVYEQLKSRVEKPLVLQEFGLSSNRGLWSPLGNTEEDQASYYKYFSEILDQNNIHYLPWTLYDFTEVPASVVGRLPWHKHKQRHFGFIDKNNQKKKSYQYLNN